jgi:sugar lactone lactonase YvrE
VSQIDSGSVLSRVMQFLAFAIAAFMLAACSGGGGGGGSSSGSTGASGLGLVPPIIVVQAQSLKVATGQPATFSVGATGTAPLNFQWLRDGQPISGATSSSFTLPNAQLVDNNARFDVVVTNAAGAATSSVVTLTVVPQPGIALIAGNVGGAGSLDGTGPTARFLQPASIAIDAAGNLYVPDGSAIRKVTAAGVVTTLAGSPVAPGSADGPAASARFGNLSGAAVDASANVYVTDTSSNTIRRITAAGVVSTFAGTVGVAGSADGAGAAASFNAPIGLAADVAGNVYVADTGNDTIRKITPAGVVTTLAGTHGVVGSADGSGAAARFNAPSNLAVTAAGNLLVTDTGNNTIRLVTSAGVVTTVAGRAGTAGSADGAGTAATFNVPSAIAVDGGGNAYVGDLGTFILRKVTTAGVVTTIAGGVGVAGFTDGTGTAARFATPSGLASDASGTLFVADQTNAVIRQISTAAVVSTFAGAPAISGSADGAASVATFNEPFSVAVDAALNVYVGDFLGATLRKVTPAGVVSTLAGSPGMQGSADGTGAAARFATMQGVAVDAAGTVYVADRLNQSIRKVTPAGVVTTLAGSPSVVGAADGVGASASFDAPTAVAVDAVGNLYVADGNPTVRKITPAGAVTTIAGARGRIGNTDGPGSVASFGSPQGIAVDAAGNVYVADATNATVRKITTAGVVSTIAGIAGHPGAVDGPATSAQFTLPFGIAVNAAGVIYVVDLVPPTLTIGPGGISRTSNGSHVIRQIDVAGNVMTVAGTTDTLRGVRLGAFPGHFDSFSQVAVDVQGNLYGTDENGVLRITFP